MQIVKVKHFFDDLYLINFYFALGVSRKSFCKYMKNNYDLNIAEETMAHGSTFWDKNEKGLRVFVWTKENKKSKYFNEILVHELIHAKNSVFDHVGQSINFESDEFEAYYFQKLFREALK